jgi:hypothetical protein
MAWKLQGLGAVMSSSPWRILHNGDEDVATPAMDLERGGDVLIAMGDCRVPSIPDPLPHPGRGAKAADASI